MQYKRPPPDWLPQTQCFGKHRFADAGLAKKVAHRSAQRKESKASAYRCQTCGGWHVGTSKTTKLKQGKKYPNDSKHYPSNDD